MVNLNAIRAIDIHTHAEEPCGLHAQDGYDDLQTRMAKYFGAPWTHPPTVPETAAHYRAQNIARIRSTRPSRRPGSPRFSTPGRRASVPA